MRTQALVELTKTLDAAVRINAEKGAANVLFATYHTDEPFTVTDELTRAKPYEVAIEAPCPFRNSQEIMIHADDALIVTGHDARTSAAVIIGRVAVNDVFWRT